MRRYTGLVCVLALAVLVFGGISGCGPQSNEEIQSGGGEVSDTQLAPGLYELEDGSVQAVGTLEWSDLEGGFWVITGGTQAEGNVGETVAVIANADEFSDELDALKNRQVVASGTKLEGASIRMAGPEIEVESIQEMAGTGGPAE